MSLTDFLLYNPNYSYTIGPFPTFSLKCPNEPLMGWFTDPYDPTTSEEFTCKVHGH